MQRLRVWSISAEERVIAYRCLPAAGWKQEKKYFDIPYTSSLNFTGREDELKLMCQMPRLGFSAGASQSRIAIHGLSGVGKTQLAIKFAEINRSAYDTIFFITASTEKGIMESYERLHELLQLEQPTNDAKVDQIKRWFSQEGNNNWLLIFDNADKLESLHLTQYIPVANGQVIITTQDRRISDSNIAKTFIALDHFPLGDSETLLKSRSGIESYSQEEALAIEEIARLLGHHPLAFDSAAAYVHHTHSSFCQYLEDFRLRSSQLLAYREQWDPYDKSVTTCLDLSYSRVEEENEQATALLLLLAHLDGANISRELLRRAASPQLRVGSNGEPYEQTPDQGCVDSSLIALVSDPIALGEAIQCLSSLSLISPAKVEMGQDFSGFSLHTLVQSHACSRIRGPSKEKVLLQTIAFVAQAFPSLFFWERFGNIKAAR